MEALRLDQHPALRNAVESVGFQQRGAPHIPVEPLSGGFDHVDVHSRKVWGGTSGVSNAKHRLPRRQHRQRLGLIQKRHMTTARNIGKEHVGAPPLHLGRGVQRQQV